MNNNLLTIFNLLIVLILLCINSSYAQSANLINDIQCHQQQFYITMQKNISQHRILYLTQPERLVVDIYNSNYNKIPQVNCNIIKQIRYGLQNNDNLRVVFDLTQPIKLTNHLSKNNKLIINFTKISSNNEKVKPLDQPINTKNIQKTILNHNIQKLTSSNYNNRLKANLKKIKNINYYQLQTKEKPTDNKPLTTCLDYTPINDLYNNAIFTPVQCSSLPFTRRAIPIINIDYHFTKEPIKKLYNSPIISKTAQSEYIIIIDPGHGGTDPGTISSNNIEEKAITLEYAKLLKHKLENNYGYKVRLTRYEDVSVSLIDRIKINKSLNGQLFISLHADHHTNHKMRGLSVYTLAEQASDNEAAKLALEENDISIINDLNIENEEPEVLDIIFDLVQREAKNLSAELAKDLINELAKNIKLINNTHRFANFKVLRGTNIPSVLIELGYLSNKDDEKLLISDDYKKKVTSAISKAIDVNIKKQLASAKLNMLE